MTYQIGRENPKRANKKINLINYFKSTKKSVIEPLIKKTSTFNSEGTISEILSKLNDNRTECFTIKNNSCYFINNRMALSKKKNNRSMKIHPLMQPIPYLRKTDTIAKAVKIFLNYKVNSIPVLNNKKISGEVRILSILEKMLENNLTSIPADYLKHRYTKIASNKSINSVRRMLKEEQMDVLPVEKKGKINQIITSNDIVSILNTPQRIGTLGTLGKTKIRSLGMQIANIGTKEFPKCGTTESLEEIVKKILEKEQNYCVLTSQSNEDSWITSHDIIELCNRNTKEQIPIYFIKDKNEKNLRPLLTKLNKPLERFSKSIEKIIEARISINNQKTTGLETQYEQTLLLITSRKHYSFSINTWSIEEGISKFAEMILEKISSKKSKSSKSIRKTSKYEILAKKGSRS
ncbi:CBS domain-containing protein [Nitrosopumilus sp. S4]